MQAAKYMCTAHALAMGSANIVWVRLSLCIFSTQYLIFELSAGSSLYRKPDKLCLQPQRVALLVQNPCSGSMMWSELA